MIGTTGASVSCSRPRARSCLPAICSCSAWRFQHATQWRSSCIRSNDGVSTLQMSIASPQRGLNAQPAGSFARSSGSPGMPISISTVVSTRGTEASRPRVYGWLGAAKHASIGARSTMRPPYMTCTRSQNSATTPRSWVIMRIETPSSSDSSLSSFRIWSWMVTSSPVVGSSAISSAGSPASAVAIITRWRMPPDSSYGYCFNRSFVWEMPTSSSSSAAAHLALARGSRPPA